MFGFGKRDPQDQPPMPRWMAWLLFGFILYLVVIGNVERNAPPPEAGKTATSKTEAVHDYPAIRRAFDIHNWQRGFNPTLDKGLSVRDFMRGKGRPASCGDEVTIMLRGRTAKGKNFDEAHDDTKPLTFTLGAGQTYKAVEQGLFGMKQGGERSIDAPPVLVYGKEKSAKELASLELRVTLNTLEPEFAEDAPPLLVSSEAQGAGATCGDTIAVDMRSWDAGNEKPTKLPIGELTLGKRQLAIGLDYALVGITPGETRLVLLPPAYQLHEGNDSPFAGKAMQLVEVTRKK